MAEINGVSVPFIPIVGNSEVASRKIGREASSSFDAI